MDLLTREELLFLINHKNEPLVSIYIPTYMSGTDSLQNQTKFKNLIKQMKGIYRGDELISMALNELLIKTDEFIDNYEFWQHQSENRMRHSTYSHSWSPSSSAPASRLATH